MALTSHALPPGVVWAYRGQAGTPAQRMTGDDIADALNASAGWVWLHVDLIDHRTLAWMSRSLPLPEAARTILEGQANRLSLGYDDGVVHGVCADFHSEFERESTSVGREYFAVNERLLVTGRRHTLAGARSTRDVLEGGFAPADAFALFEALVGAFCDATAARLVRMMHELDTVEDEIIGERLDDERRRLRGVRRLAVSLHRPLAALAALFQSDGRAAWPLPSSAHEVLRRLAQRLDTIDRDLVLVNDRAKLLQEEVATELTEESNRSLRALTVLSSLLLPGTLVAGIYGMNTADMPFQDTPGGTWFALMTGAAATLAFLWILRRLGGSLRF